MNKLHVNQVTTVTDENGQSVFNQTTDNYFKTSVELQQVYPPVPAVALEEISAEEFNGPQPAITLSVIYTLSDGAYTGSTYPGLYVGTRFTEAIDHDGNLGSACSVDGSTLNTTVQRAPGTNNYHFTLQSFLKNTDGSFLVPVINEDGVDKTSEYDKVEKDGYVIYHKIFPNTTTSFPSFTIDA